MDSIYLNQTVRCESGNAILVPLNAGNVLLTEHVSRRYLPH